MLLFLNFIMLYENYVLFMKFNKCFQISFTGVRIQISFRLKAEVLF